MPKNLIDQDLELDNYTTQIYFYGFVNLTGLGACKTAVDDMIDEMRNFYE